MAREMVSFLIGGAGKTWLDDLAHRLRAPRSTVIRHALVIARRHETELIKSIEENP